MKKLGFIFVLCVVSYFLSSCSPALQDALANSINQSTQNSTRQAAINKAPPLLRAECIARSQNIRLNTLQQGPNFCFLTALAPIQLGQIQRVRVHIQYAYSVERRTDTFFEYSIDDQAWKNDRFGTWIPLLMPDSIGGVISATLSGVFTDFYSIVRQGLILKVSQYLGIDPRLITLPYLDSTRAFGDAASRFGNLNERPLLVFATAQICNDICAESQLLTIQTR